ncbi:MAG: hypothetical protein S0880_02120 [Actinomycetota bacterium]|nr:hypothetical protein [Actinomycetota bacterium]
MPDPATEPDDRDVEDPAAEVSIGTEANEADVAEQRRGVERTATAVAPREIPVEASEADVLEQWRDAYDEDDDER